jgi:hypothetical protein
MSGLSTFTYVLPTYVYNEKKRTVLHQSFSIGIDTDNIKYKSPGSFTFIEEV